MFQVNPLLDRARQRIDLKFQALFSSKDKSKILKCCLLPVLFGALRVKILYIDSKSKLVHTFHFCITIVMLVLSEIRENRNCDSMH